jgi:class 3 adenylate cyclase
MRIVGPETCPLPDDPVLAATAAALNDAGQWGEIVDRDWGTVYLTDEARWIYGGKVELAPFPLGGHVSGPERVSMAMEWRGGQFPLEIHRRFFAMYGPWFLADTPGGREELRALVDPRLADMVDDLEPVELPPAATIRFNGIYTGAGAGVETLTNMLRLRDATGTVVGSALVSKPAVGMAALTRMTALGDLGHFERMDRVAKAGRRASAVLFADLESSSPLSRKLSTASYFALVRRLARAADQCVVDAGGLVGTHAGDGIVAFFLAETSGSESAAARACVTAARALRDAVGDVAARCELAPEDVVLRFGMHWGANLYVGQIATSGRTEVTALGDQVNETARIEACASGGRALASKDLVERLEPGDATALDLHPDAITYTPLGDLASATEKARRDAPEIAVCEVWTPATLRS